MVMDRVMGGGASTADGPGDVSRVYSRRGPRAPGRPMGLGGGAGLPTAGLGGAVGAPGRYAVPVCGRTGCDGKGRGPPVTGGRSADGGADGLAPGEAGRPATPGLAGAPAPPGGWAAGALARTTGLGSTIVRDGVVGGGADEIMCEIISRLEGF